MSRKVWTVLLGAVCLTAGSIAWGQSIYFSPDDDQPIIELPGQEPVYYLDFAFERPRWITVDGKKYFYMPYKVTNHGKKKVDYRPDFQLETNTGRRYVAQFHRAAFEAIRKQIRREYLVSQLDLNETGVPEGPENARYSAAIWEEFDDRADSFNIFVGALTNYPPKKVKNPLFSPEKKEEEYFLVNRRVMLEYAFPGAPKDEKINPDGRAKSWPSLERIKWVWR
jgi:hypothetical protein